MAKDFLTFDIEEWYHANFPGYEVDEKHIGVKTNLELLVDRLLSLCERTEARATFFVVGEVAERYPEMIKKIAQKGHELAAHSWSHQQVSKMSPQEFLQDATKTKNVLEQLSGKKVLGYRAPSWSVNTEILPWYYKILADAGYTYSSSVFPVKNFLYGIPDANKDPHAVKLKNGVQIVEYPCSVVSYAGKNIGFSGGVYYRLFPRQLLAFFWWLNKRNKKSTFFYLHPREIDPTQPRIPLPAWISFLHYYGIRQTESKLLATLRFGGFQSTLAEETNLLRKKTL